MTKYRFAIASLVLGLLSFVPLWGADKAVLAVLFGSWALKETFEVSRSRTVAAIGIILGFLQLALLIAVLIFHLPYFSSVWSVLQ